MRTKIFLLLSWCSFLNASIVAQTTVNYASGTANTSIPLMEIAGKQMSYPLALFRNSSGVKVNEVASDVGIGWSLNSGGRILRVKRGYCDERVSLWDHDDNEETPNQVKSAGFLWCKDFLNIDGDNVSIPSEVGTFYWEERFDFKPDEFLIQAPGLNAQFVFAPGSHREGIVNYNSEVRNQQSAVTVYPFQNLKVEYTLSSDLESDIVSFTITTTEGLKYFFNRTSTIEVRAQTSTDTNVGHFNSSESYVDSWYLTKIEDIFGRTELTCSYNENPEESLIREYMESKNTTSGLQYVYETKYGDFDFVLNSILQNDREYFEECSVPYTYNYSIIDTRRKEMKISSMKTEMEELLFEYQTDERWDLNNDHALKSVTKLVNNEVVDKVVFETYYFDSPQTNRHSIVLDQDIFRLKLVGFKHFNSLNMPINKGYRFDYYEEEVPFRNSYSQDYWGYFNGALNTSFMLKHDFAKPYGFMGESANREPGRGICRLKRINNDLGGFEEYHYDSHTYSKSPEGTDLEDANYNRVTISAQANVPNWGCDNATDPRVNQEVQYFSLFEAQTVQLDFELHRESECSTALNCSFNQLNVEIRDASTGNLEGTILFDADHFINQFSGANPVSEISESRLIPLNAGSYVLIVSSEIDISTGSRIACGSASASLTYWRRITTHLPRKAGGDRIKAIQISDGDTDRSNDIWRRFEYKLPDKTIEISSGVLLTIPRMHDQTYNGLDHTTFLHHTSALGINNDDYRVRINYDCQLFVTNTYSSVPVLSSSGSVVMYSSVDEFLDESGSASGRINYEYDISILSDMNAPICQIEQAPIYRNEALRELIVYDASGNVVSSEYYEYEEIEEHGYASSFHMSKEVRSVDGSDYLEIFGIDEEALNQATKTAIINSGPAIILGLINPPTAPLAIAAVAMEAFNVARVIGLNVFNSGMIQRHNSADIIKGYDAEIVKYSSTLFRIKSRTVKEVSDNAVDFRESKITFSYDDSITPHANGFFQTVTQPVQVLTTCLQDQDKVRGTRTKFTSQYDATGCTAGNDLLAFGVATLQNGGFFDTPVESVSLVGSSETDLFVNGAQLAQFGPVSEMVPNASNGNTVAVPIKSYVLQQSKLVPLQDFQWSSVDANAFMSFDSRYLEIGEVTAYDNSYSPATAHRVHGSSNSILRSQSHDYPILEVMNSDLRRVRYMGFEDYEEHDRGNWDFAENNLQRDVQTYNGFTMSKAKTGRNYYRFGSEIQIALEPGSYSLSFWSSSSNMTVYTENFSNPISVHAGVEEDTFGWRYHEYRFNGDGTGVLHIMGLVGVKIDEIRIIPDDAFAISRQFNNVGQLSGMCDVNNKCNYVYYDPFYRPRWEIDNERNIRSFTKFDDILSSDPHNKLASITTRVMKEEGEQYANAMNLDLEPIGFYMTSTAYLDGLGRPIQKVLRNASGGNDPKDVMQFKQYNQYGISQKSYLPYVRFNSSHGYRANFIQESLQFYANQSGIAHTSEPYAESRIKAEPNHSVQEMGGVGSDFNLVSGHTTKLSVLLNSAEEVRLWQLNSSGEYDGNSFWPAGSLTKQVITDPNNKTSEVFTDVFGRTILSRRLVQVSGVEEGRAYTAGVGIRTENASFLNDQVFADHYYIYDGFDRLIIEIPPLFVEEMNSTGVWIFGTIEGQTNAASFLGYATGILYDGKGRVTESHSPNGGWSYNVYNQRDELVMSQNVEQRSENQWSFLRYDKYGRVVLTGVTTLEGPVERAVLQDQWDAVAENLNEVRNGVATTHGYTQNAPIPGEQDILTVNYFDDLNFDTQNATPQNQFQPTVLTKLKLTGSKVKVVGTENYLVSVNYYDKKGRLSQAYNSNFFGGYEYRLVEYDFLNKPINAERKILNLETNAMLNVRNEFEYDAAGRLKKIFQRTGPVSEPMIQLVAFEYNALGQLHKKHLYKTASEVHAMQIIDYRYNIQGWLTKINNSNLEDDGDNMESDDVFGEELLYTKSDYSGNTFMDSCEPRPTEMFNGLPSAMKWNVNASFDPHDYLLTEDGTTIPENAYVFRYDDLYRLTDASYAKEDLTADGDSEDCLGNYGAFEADLDHYSEFLSYDLGGNILQLKRYTGNAGIAEVMDNLHYKYIDHTNLLKRVDETSPYLASSGASHSQYQETAGLLVEFDYNKKGSITSNFEKGLSFKYNKIGLTASVSKVGETQDVHYLYAATGEKISKVIGEKEWFYVNGVEYLKENNIIKLIQVATMEGAVRPTPDGAQNSEDFVYDYYITDHLGNTRVIVSTENAVPISVLATHEYEHVLEEISYFDGVIEPASPRPVEWPNSQELNNIVAKLSSTGRTIGPSRLISVRANDKMKVEVESFYSSSEQSTGQTQSIGQIFGSILLNLMTQGQGVIPGGENGLQLFTQANSAPVGSLQNFLLNTSELNTDKPDAYLVYIFFDMNLNVVKQQSGVIPVGDPDALAKLAKDWEVAAQHGYFYTYVTNRNSRSVYFNNLKVDHQRGSVKQIFNYYPYGLMWENPTEQNANAYQGKEWQQQEWSSAGLEMYDFHARMYDPVLGRWHAPDPMNQFDSPYNAMGDNPVVNIDPDGMMAIGGIREWFRRTFLNKTGSGIQKVGRGRDRSEKISKGSGAGNVTSTGVVETFNDLYSVGMAVVHAFEISTQLNAGQENVINGANYNYYFDRFGTLTAKTVRDASNNAIFIAQGDMTNPTWKEYDEGFIRQYLAVIVGEAGQHDDAAGVGAVIMNRFAAKANVNKPVAMDGNFIKKLGGKGQYDAISVGENDEKSYYYKVMHSSFDVVFGSNTGFQERIQGGLSALSAKTLNEVNGFLNTPHFWEGAKEYKIHAKGPMKVINENWFTKHVANSEIYMTGSAGGSYFFNYTNKTPYLQKRRWP